MQVETNEFVRSHGRQPRGWGRWGFFFNDDQDVEKAFWSTGRFAYTRNMAVTFAVSKGFTRVRVAP